VRCYGITDTEGGPRALLLVESGVRVHGALALLERRRQRPLADDRVRVGQVSYAAFHACWWTTALGQTIGAWGDTSGDFGRFRAEFAKRLPAFIDHLGDRLAPERRAIYARLMQAWPRLLTRYGTHRGLTIVHGDAHVWNAFHPRDPAKDTIRLFDFDSWRIDTASDDLAYMMGLHWYPGRRRRLERPLLERYHATLLATA